MSHIYLLNYKAGPICLVNRGQRKIPDRFDIHGCFFLLAPEFPENKGQLFSTWKTLAGALREGRSLCNSLPRSCSRALSVCLSVPSVLRARTRRLRTQKYGESTGDLGRSLERMMDCASPLPMHCLLTMSQS